MFIPKTYKILQLYLKVHIDYNTLSSHSATNNFSSTYVNL
jgi:hypothetical protein